MAQQKQRQGRFHFSLPWVAAQAAPRTTRPPAPVIEAPLTPAQRLPPATSQNLNQQQSPPPRAQQSNDIEARKLSPSRASAKSRFINSEPPSPSRISSQSRNTTKPPSPSQTSTQSRTPTQPPSPSPSPTQRKPRTVTQPPTPPRVNSRSWVAPQASSPSRTMPNRADAKQSSQAVPKNQSPPTMVTQSDIVATNHPSTSPILYENEINRIGPQPEVEGNHDKVKQSSDEKFEDTIKGVDLVQEQKTITQTKDTDVSLSSGFKEPILAQDDLASDEEPKQVEEEKVVSITATLNPTSSTKEQTKIVISDLVGSDRAHVSHHKNNTSSQTSPSHQGIRDDISKFVGEVTNKHQKLPLDENLVSVITLMGENRGASMTLGYESTQREGEINIRRGYKVNPHESSDSTTKGEKGSSEEKANDSKGQEDENPKVYINNNMQSINNSIMFNSSITDRDPGVHFTQSCKVMEHMGETKGTKPGEAYKTKFNVAQSQKLSYKPVVRRRCLRGLFMESSDSDPDNPDKQRRHGCRYVCGEKSSKTKVDAL